MERMGDGEVRFKFILLPFYCVCNVFMCIYKNIKIKLAGLSQVFIRMKTLNSNNCIDIPYLLLISYCDVLSLVG